MTDFLTDILPDILPDISPLLVPSITLCALCALSCATAPNLAAQALEISGGDSSLYQAGGGSLSWHAPNYDLTLSAGTADGQLLAGARMIKPTPGGIYIYGDDKIDFQLPTDIFDSSHFLDVRGLGFRGTRFSSELTAFAGFSAQTYNSPFFNAANFRTPTGVIFLKHQINKNLQFFSDTVIAAKTTEIESLRWTPAIKTELSFAAGIGANQAFEAVSFARSRPSYDIQAAYIGAGQGFHRTSATFPQLSEPDRENILVVLRPIPNISLSAGHQNFLIPDLTDNSNSSSSVDQGSASLQLWQTQLNGSFFYSTYLQTPQPLAMNHAVSFSIMRDLTRRFNIRANYLVSKPKDSLSIATFTSTVTEQLTPHLSVSENLVRSNGQTSVNFGGSILSNLITLTATYEQFYIPAQNDQPFENALLLDLRIRLLGRLLLHGATFVDPTGHLRYTADGYTILNKTPAAPKGHETTFGRFVLSGCVLDTHGAPVEGAKILIDQNPVYSDSNGCFELREHARRIHQLRIALREFLMEGEWQVASMPATITSVSEDRSLEATVVIRLRNLRPSTPPTTGEAPPTPGRQFP